MSEQNHQKIKVGVSTCLLGEKVRWDGGHKRDAYVCDVLSSFLEFVPLCPELEIGLGVPRPPIRLVDKGGEIRLLGSRDVTLDATEKMRGYFDTVKARLDGICGYILKSKSPSCGMERIKVYSEAGMPISSQSGLYAERMMQAFPLIPVEDEGRLHDSGLRENFIERLFVYHRWQQLLEKGLSVSELQRFHSEHKLMFMAHHPQGARQLGQMAASFGEHGEETLEQKAYQYCVAMMDLLKHKATPRLHANVLQHLMGYLKKELSSGDKEELLWLIDQYRLGYLPLIVPITMLKHHFKHHPHPYPEHQHYLQPHPFELMLRNRV
jgi:uncharacterized protein YbgA (DUF1722 family)/uncharacterized protein YbbK (DUF523 family)